MKRVRIVPFLMAISFLGALAPVGIAQSAAGEGSSSRNVAAPFSSTTHTHVDLAYVRPTEKIKIRNYLFDAFGSRPMVSGWDRISVSPWPPRRRAMLWRKRFAKTRCITAASAEGSLGGWSMR
jgi:hypothetical protein